MQVLKSKGDIYAKARQNMVSRYIIPRGITQKEVIDALLSVPRHMFVEEALYGQEYGDSPLPIGDKQTISQPYMVALMTEALALKGKTAKVLEIGTGSGYQSAVLSMLADKVYSIERIPAIASRARRVLDSLRCQNVIIKVGDGSLGWPEAAPFDAIIVTAASPGIPSALVEQLSEGGRMVIPVGSEDSQELIKLTKTNDGVTTETIAYCRFVKLIGRHGFSEKETLG